MLQYAQLEKWHAFRGIKDMWRYLKAKSNKISFTAPPSLNLYHVLPKASSPGAENG
jgi:hypothetical protein